MTIYLIVGFGILIVLFGVMLFWNKRNFKKIYEILGKRQEQEGNKKQTVHTYDLVVSIQEGAVKFEGTSSRYIRKAEITKGKDGVLKLVVEI